VAPYVRGVSADRVVVCSLECIEVLPLPGGGVTFLRHGSPEAVRYADLLAICEAQARFITATLHPEAT